MSYQPPAGGQPSYKTNVNRAKTKRWVEAKSYSYDGDDWGDIDDYNEYQGYDEPQAQAAATHSKPTGLRQRGQSTTQPAQTFQHAPNEKDAFENMRKGYGNTGGPIPLQQNYGTRSITNPQPQVNINRSNSFDRGDEGRTFPSPISHQDLSHDGHYSRPAQASHQPTNPSHQAPYQSPSQQSLHQIQSSQTPPHKFSAHQGPPQGPSQGQMPPYITSVDQQPQSPTQPSPSQRGSTLVEPDRVPLLPHSYFNDDKHNQSIDPSSPSTGNYRGVSYSDQPHQASLDNRTQSMASNNSSLDFHNRRDFSASVIPSPLQTRSSPSPHRSSGSRSSSQFPPRKSSLSQENQPNTLISNQPASNFAMSMVDNNSSGDDAGNNSSNKPLPFVRPADIYKRMNEEKERARKSQDSSRPSIEGGDPANNNASARSSTDSQEMAISRIGNVGNTKDEEPSRSLRPVLESVTERQSDYNKDYAVSDQQGDLGHSSKSSVIGDTLRPILPDVTRMSGFGDLFPIPLQATEEQRLPESQPHLHSLSQAVSQEPPQTKETDLQHQPSSGFRSVVHQAFDQVPATPSSTSGSGIGRSTSGGTSVISPIISRGPSVSTRNLQDSGSELRTTTPPIPGEAITSNNSRPISSGTLDTPKHIVRKPSPTQSPVPGLNEPIPPTFIPGHRRDTSTPSPNNSPARTPALEINRKLRQPLEAELAVVSPTEPAFSTNLENLPQGAATEESSKTSVERPTHAEVIRPDVAEGSNGLSRFNAARVPMENDARDQQQMNTPEPSSISSSGRLQSRADSPSKNRVRDLAGRFESASSSRPGSAHSGSQPIITIGEEMQKDAQVRPLADRLESFRPQLPGGWESFASSAPAGAPIKPKYDHGGGELQEQIVTAVDNPEITNLAPTTARFAPLEDQSTTSQLAEKPQTEPTVEHSLNDPFTAVVAAGTALAGAIVAAVGMERGDSPSESNNVTLTKNTITEGSKNDTKGTTSSRAAFHDANLHSEASIHIEPISLGDDASSGALTSVSKASLQTREDILPIPEHNDPITPTAHHTEHDVLNAHSRNQAILPPLSTDTQAQQYESDRLRREIVKNLSPRGISEPTTAESESPWQDGSKLSAEGELRTYGHDSMIIPSEYESYWNGSTSGEENSPKELTHGRPTATSFPSQNSEVQISPTKPLQVARVKQAENIKTNENLEGPVAQPTMLPHESERVGSENDRAEKSPTEESYNQSQNNISTGSENLTESKPVSNANEDYFKPNETLSPSLRIVNENPTTFPMSSLPMSVPALSSTHNGSVYLPEQKVDNLGPNILAIDYSNRPPSYVVGPETIETPSRYVGPLPTNMQDGRAYGMTAGYAGNQNSNDPRPEQREERRTVMATMSNPASEEHILQSPSPPMSAQPKIPAFREILSLKTPSQRIQAYNEARDQFASLNTGLAHWLSVKLKELPEHADVVSGHYRPPASGIGSKPPPFKAKITGLRPGGNQTATQPYYQQHLGASPHTQETGGVVGQKPQGSGSLQGLPITGGSSSKTPNQQAQTKGKDFLHSAGVFGGKANTAAKGLFSKGRSKLRGGGIGDKHHVTQSTPNIDPLPRGMQPPHQPQATQIPPGQEPSNISFQAERYSVVESNQPSQNQHLYEQVTPTSPNTAYRPLYTNSNTQPISNQIVRSSNSSASHTSTYVSHENNFSRAHLDRQPTDQIPQIHAATDGNTTPTLFHETSTAKAYQESSSLDHKSVPSSIKTKQTSTQADFYSADQHKEASSLPATEDIQPLLKSDFEVPHQFNVNALPRSQNANGYAGALSVPRLLHDAERSQSSQVPQTTFTDGRFLEDSKKISNTTWQSEQFRTEPRTQHQHMPQFQQNSTLQESMLNGIPITQDSSLAKLAPSSTSERARTPDRPTSRPFSFMEMSPDQRIKPEEELLNRAPSMESTSNHGRLDRPPSPVSPQRSMTRDLSDQQSRSIPTHHDTSHDFSVSDDQQRLRNRPRSFSRPFREPDLHEHPAFRQEEERQEVAAERRYTSAPYEQARLPRQQTTEYQLEGVGPPTTTQRSDSNAKSRRASRSSAFFKNLTNPARVEGPPLSIEPEAQHTESSSRNPVSGEVKNKRASIFRSTNERRGSTREKSTGAVDTPTPAPPTDLPRKMSTTKPRNSEIDKTVKAGSSKVRSKLQRATTSAAAEQDAGKKKRFSALGSLFGRSKQEKPRPTTQVFQPSTSLLDPPPPSQPPSSDPSTQYSTPVGHDHRQYAPAQEYYARPPIGGYYAPNNSGLRTAGPRIQQARPTYTSSPEPPAYIQDSTLRQNNVTRSQTTSAAATRPPANPSQSFRSPSYTGSYRSSGYSPNPPQTLQADRVGQDNHLQSTTWSASTNENPRPRRTWHTISSSAHSFSHTPPAMTPSPGPHYPSEPPPHQLLSSQYPSNPYFPPQQQQPLTFSTYPQQPLSFPPVPPLKDEWQPTHSPSHSTTMGLMPSTPSRANQPSPRPSLPPIQTDVPSPAGRSRTEMRKSRQMEIEHGISASSAGSATVKGLGNPYAEERRGRDDSSDEEIVMSSTSYPGMEWQPKEFGGWERD